MPVLELSVKINKHVHKAISYEKHNNLSKSVVLILVNMQLVPIIKNFISVKNELGLGCI